LVLERDSLVERNHRLGQKLRGVSRELDGLRRGFIEEESKRNGRVTRRIAAGMGGV
jgi:hypothetical protein